MKDETSTFNPSRAAYNASMDGVACKRCGHGSRDHADDYGSCFERDATGRLHYCPCPEFTFGFSGQRGSEAGCYS